MKDQDKKQLTFPEVLFTINKFLFLKTDLKKFASDPKALGESVSFEEARENFPKVISLVKKYYPIHKQLFQINHVMEQLGLIAFQVNSYPLNIQYTQELIDIAPGADIVNNIYNKYEWTNFDKSDKFSMYHLTHTHELIEFFIRNGVCAEYFEGIARSVVFFTEDNYSEGALSIFREKMQFLLNHCRDVIGLPGFAKYVALSAMGLEDIPTLKLALKFNPKFTKEDKQKIKEHGCSKEVINVYLDYVRQQDEQSV